VRSGTGRATLGLVALCACLFAVSLGAPGQSLIRGVWRIDGVETLLAQGALAAPEVWHEREWHRLLSAGLLHGSLVHCLLNMLALLGVGGWLERVLGGWRLLLCFMAASVGACATSLAFAEAELVVGASGGIFGLAGALVLARMGGPAEVRTRLAPVSARWLGGGLVFWLGLGFLLPAGFIAQAGHIGGFLVGSALGFGLLVRGSRARVGLLGLAIALLGLAVYTASHAGWTSGYHEITGQWALRNGNPERAAAAFDEALSRSPDDPALANAVAYGLVEADVDLDRALPLVEQALAVDPDNPDYLDTRGWISCKLGHLDAAMRDLERACAQRPNDPVLADHLARCHLVGPR
jgi:membrane associated rhomboid family serine protease